MPTATDKEWDEVSRSFARWAASKTKGPWSPTTEERWSPAKASQPISAEEFLRKEEPAVQEEAPVMPEESAARKGIPMHAGLLQYFPSALASVAQVSRVCNDKHNPGQPLHWSKENSNDHLDALVRHLADTAVDPLARDPEDGTLLAAKVAWRALAQLQVLHDAGADIFHS